jgi:hypothetical protein
MATTGGTTVGRRGGELRLFFFVFLLTSMAVTLVGMTATSGFSLPALGERLGLLAEESGSAIDWGEIRFIHTTTRVRADRSTRSAIVSRLMPGDSVRADFIEAGWYAVFPIGTRERDVKQALGYVYAPLLKETRPSGVTAAAR